MVGLPVFGFGDPFALFASQRPVVLDAQRVFAVKAHFAEPFNRAKRFQQKNRRKCLQLCRIRPTDPAKELGSVLSISNPLILPLDPLNRYSRFIETTGTSNEVRKERTIQNPEPAGV